MRCTLDNDNARNILMFLKEKKAWLNYSCIARELNISRVTVRKYIGMLYDKNHVKMRKVNKRKNVWIINDTKNKNRKLNTRDD